MTLIESLQQKKQKVIQKEFQEIQIQEEEKNAGIMKVTAKMFRAVYIEIKTNIPFNSHSAITQLLEANGVFMGYHHYERRSAVRMMESMSALMHKNIMSYVVSKNYPVSIILDGSTDSSEKHYLIVYFQTIEENIPIVYFYKLIPTSDN